jgi:hypothetical protein
MDAGFGQSDIKQLTGTLWAGRAALIDRYGGAHLDRVPGARALRDRMRASGIAALRGEDIERELLPKFERLLAEEPGDWAVISARTIMGSRDNGWVRSSSCSAAAVMKQWAKERFGVEIV